MSTDVLLRKPPQNVEAEAAVLGGVAIQNELFDLVADIVDVNDFYAERHRLIWQAMQSLAAAKRPIDAVHLAEALRAVLEQVGGLAYIAEICGAVPAPSQSVHYARIVREKSVQRRLAAFGTETAAKAYDAPQPWSPEWTEEALAVAEYELHAVASRMIRKPEPTKVDTLGAVLWNLDHGIKRGVQTGFASVDQVFGGFDVGHLTMLAARTSKGKTAFALNTAINVAREGSATAFFTLEMSAEEMWLRGLAVEASVDTFRARRNGLSDLEKTRLADARQTLGEMPLEILYRPSMRPRDLRVECGRLAREVGTLGLVIVDYLALMRGDQRERERWREMQEVVLALKSIAGELGVPILLLQQLNREAKDNIPPSLSTLRDTGATEEHASNVLFLWQEPRPDDEPRPDYGTPEPIDVIIAKQRNGPAGMRIPLSFKKHVGIFSD